MASSAGRVPVPAPASCPRISFTTANQYPRACDQCASRLRAPASPRCRVLDVLPGMYADTRTAPSDAWVSPIRRQTAAHASPPTFEAQQSAPGADLGRLDMKQMRRWGIGIAMAAAVAAGAAAVALFLLVGNEPET